MISHKLKWAVLSLETKLSINRTMYVPNLA